MYYHSIGADFTLGRPVVTQTECATGYNGCDIRLTQRILPRNSSAAFIPVNFKSIILTVYSAF